MYIGNEVLVIKQQKLLSEIEILERTIRSFEKAVYENIGQILSLVKMQLSIIDLKKINESKVKINHSGQLIGKAIHDLRHMTKQIGTKEIIDKGFAFAIEYELERIKYSKTCDTNFKLYGSFFKLHSDKELLVFSILQILILDILVSQVSRLIVKLGYSEKKIRVKIIHENREKGFVARKLINDNLKLNYRLKLIKARLIVKSLDNNGIIFIAIK